MKTREYGEQITEVVYGLPSEMISDSPPPRVWWHGEIDPEASRKFLIKNLIPETGNGLLPGQWGTYKTFAALDLACAVMTGTEFAGYPVKRRGGVLFIACEGRSEIPIRLQAINENKCRNRPKLPFVCMEDCPAKLLAPGAVESIAAAANEIAAEMQKRFKLPLALIIVDTVIAAAGYRKSGEENDAAIAQQIMEVLSQVSRLTGAFALAVDHFGKNAETGTRGSSAKEGSAEIVLALLGERELSGAVKNPRLAVRKRRGGPSGIEIPFTVRAADMGHDEDGDPVTTLVIDWKPGAAVQPDKKGGWTKSLRLLHRSLMSVLADCGTEIRPWPDAGPVRAIDRELIRVEFYKSFPADGDTENKRQAARQKSFTRAIKDAQERSLIGVRVIDDITYVWLNSITSKPDA